MGQNILGPYNKAHDVHALDYVMTTRLMGA